MEEKRLAIFSFLFLVLLTAIVLSGDIVVKAREVTKEVIKEVNIPCSQEDCGAIANANLRNTLKGSFSCIELNTTYSNNGNTFAVLAECFKNRG